MQKRTIQPISTAEQLLYSTVRISGDNGTGTGFFFQFKTGENNFVQMILTNKYVVNNNKKLSFYFHEANVTPEKHQATNQSFSIEFELREFSKIWVPHPSDDIDLGALLFVPIKKFVEKKLDKEIFCVFFDENLIKSDDTLEKEADVADEILMIGYPIGLWDEYNNFPIMRKGVTASHPALDFNGKSMGMVDIACFHGSSGSPILICMNGYHDKQGNYHIDKSKHILLGLLFNGPAYTRIGKMEIKELPATNAESVPTFDQLVHLGYYVKAKEVLALCEHIKKTRVINQG